MCLAASDIPTKVKLVFVFVIFRLPYISFCKLSKRNIVFIWHFGIADICDCCALLDDLFNNRSRDKGTCPIHVVTFTLISNLATDYRKVASTNASRFVTRLVYMHTQNDNLLIRSPS